MKKYLIISFSLLVLFTLIGNDLKKAAAENKIQGEKIQAGTICFNRDILPIFVQFCAKSGCHDQQTHEEDLILDNYNGILDKIEPGQPDDSELYERMIITDPDEKMPPPDHPQLTQTQLDLVRNWITEGALNSDCTNDPCDTSNVTFTSTIKPVILNNCRGCHSGSNPSGGIDLTSDAIIESMSNKIYGSVAHFNGYIPMPPNMNLYPCYVKQIRIWAIGEDGQPCDTSNVTYNGTIKSIIQTKCVTCHNSSNPPMNLDFTNDYIVDVNKIRIYGAMAGLSGYIPMPPGFRMNSCMTAKIRIWANPKGTVPCDTTNITYAGTISPIISSLCIGCHSSLNPPKGLNFTNDQIVETNKLRIYGSVEGLQGYVPMPPSIKINSCSISKIRIWANPVDNEPCDTSNVTYEGTIKKVLQVRCLSCHSGQDSPKGLDFTNDNLVETNKTRIYGSVYGLTGYVAMPPSIKIDSCSLAKIRIWANPVINEPCDTSNVTYEGTIKKVIQKNCLSCHSGASTPKGLDFSNDNIVITNKTRIYGAVAGLTGYVAMPPGLKLDTCSFAKIRIWANPVINEPCDTSNVTYDGVIKEVIQLKCISCHSGASSPLGLDFSIDQLVKSSKSRIFGAVAGITGYVAMPPSLPLDTCSFAKIRIWASKSDIQPCDTSDVTFSATINPILQAQCISCHSGAKSPLGLDFTQDSIVDINKNRIYGSVNKIPGYKPMPPSISIDSCLIKQIRIWASKQDNKPCDTTNITYIGTIKQIITSNCVSCHSGSNPPRGIDLTKDNFVLNSKIMIYNATAHLSGYIPMPPGSLIDSCSLTKMRIWSTMKDTIPCDTINFSYASKIRPIFEQNCLNCHSGQWAPKGLDFSKDSLSEIYKKTIYCGVSSGDGCRKMPPSGDRLDSCSIAMIKVWSEAPVSVEDDDFENSVNLSIYPNPTEKVLNIKYYMPENQIISAADGVWFEIYDLQGKRIFKKYHNDTSGINTYRIDLDGILPVGSYIFRLKIGNRIIDREFKHLR